MKRKNLFQYNSKILKVSQLAAIAVYDFIGKKNETAADRAAVQVMREELNKLDFNGTVVIGEGERDKAPMLYIGEKVGNNKSSLKVDIALDPLEGTKITANNQKNALTVISLGDKNSFLNQVIINWESVVLKYERLMPSTSFSIMRVGLVLSKEGGLYKISNNLARFYLLSPVGSGEQWQSWIHVNDAARAFIKCSR